MKKSAIIKIFTGLSVATMSLGVLASVNDLSTIFKTKATVNYNECNYYWDNLTSPYEICSAEEVANWTTWGVITQIFEWTYDDGKEIAFQATDKNGYACGLVFDCLKDEYTSLSVGDRIIVSGTPREYAGDRFFDSETGSTITKVDSTLSNEIEVFDVPSSLITSQDTSSLDFLKHFNARCRVNLPVYSIDTDFNCVYLSNDNGESTVCCNFSYLESSEFAEVASICDYAASHNINVSCEGYMFMSFDGVNFLCYDMSNLSYAGVELTSIDITNTNTTVGIGKTLQLNASKTPSYASDTLVWSSSNTSVATVSSSGLVTGVAEGNATITVSSETNSSINDSIQVTVSATDSLSFNLESVVIYDNSHKTYATNWGTKNFTSEGGNSVTMGFYRYGNYGKFYPSSNLTNQTYDSLPGSLYNVDPLPALQSIAIYYKGTGTVSYGQTKDFGKDFNLPNKSDFGLYTITPNSNINNPYSYFKIESVTSNFTIQNVTITYRTDATPVASTPSRINAGLRAHVSKCITEVTEGAQVCIPTQLKDINYDRTVKAFEILTYYSFEYVQAHKEELDLSKIAITDPKDVAAYYAAFDAIPPNYYGLKDETGAGYVSRCTPGSKDDVTAVFGSDTRAVQQFNRLSGYAQYIPHDEGTQPKYLEFDIDLDGTYGTSRGSNRVVIWPEGWEDVYYEPTAFLTDDHYVTFREFTNYYTWNAPFDAQTTSIVTNRTYRGCGTFNLKWA